jgi:predicted nucleic acid-binding protein
VSDLPSEEGATIALDTPTFAYHADRHPRSYAPSDRILEGLATGAFEGVASVLIVAETLVPYHRLNRAATARALQEAWKSIPALKLGDIGPRLADRVARLRAKYNLRTPDAVHVATALQERAEWFVTNDRRLRMIEREGLRVWLIEENV